MMKNLSVVFLFGAVVSNTSFAGGGTLGEIPVLPLLNIIGFLDNQSLGRLSQTDRDLRDFTSEELSKRRAQFEKEFLDSVLLYPISQDHNALLGLIKNATLNESIERVLEAIKKDRIPQELVLNYAIQTGNVGMFARMYELKFHHGLSNSRNIAHLAVVFGQVNILEFIRTVEPTSFMENDASGRLPIHYAQNVRALEFYLKYYSEALAISCGNGNTPASLAAEKRDWERLNFLAQNAPETFGIAHPKFDVTPIQVIRLGRPGEDFATLDAHASEIERLAEEALLKKRTE